MTDNDHHDDLLPKSDAPDAGCVADGTPPKPGGEFTDPAIVDATKDLPPLLTVEETAKFFRVSTRTLRRWARIGTLRTLRTTRSGTGKVLVERNEVRRVMQAMREPRPFGAK